MVTVPLVAWPSGLGKGLQSPVRGFDSRRHLHQSKQLSRREASVVRRQQPLIGQPVAVDEDDAQLLNALEVLSTLGGMHRRRG